MNQDWLDIFKPSEENFNRHLQLERNDRIIFSGKFGTGKTTFLQHFFKKGIPQNSEIKTHYNAVHLYPVNYSVATNEDIFQFLKYDIMCDLLLEKKVTINEANSKTYLETLKKYGSKNLDRIIATVLPLIPLVGKDAKELFDSLYKIKQEYQEFHNTTSKSDADKLTEFLDSVNKEGSIYERDFTTELIEQCLNQLKDEHESENVLIIDDLDRIDPEHIFRILNVFAAHFDERNSVKKNKFGFDKVILVCDINNIRNIFKAKFGEDTDFSGYIDKFYSREIYIHNIGNVIKLHLESLLSSIFITGNRQQNALYTAYQNGNLEYLISIFLEYNLLSLRQILKVFNNSTITIEEFETKIKFERNFERSVIDHPMLIQIEILKRLFGEYASFRNALQVLQNKFITNLPVEVSIFSDLLTIRGYNIHRFVRRPGPNRSDNYQIPDGKHIRFNFIYDPNTGQHFPSYFKLNSAEAPIQLEEIDVKLYHLFIEQVDMLYRKGFFN